ncbi:hypothetical protein D3C80_1746950 [compost metagenome]
METGNPWNDLRCRRICGGHVPSVASASAFPKNKNLANDAVLSFYHNDYVGTDCWLNYRIWPAGGVQANDVPLRAMAFG